jgi:hypothetical protein
MVKTETPESFSQLSMRDIRAALRKRDDAPARAIKAGLTAVRARYAKRRRERGPTPFAALRMRDLEAIFDHRYGRHLPDDDAGREDARIVAHHLVNLPRGDQAGNVISWLAVWAPWMSREKMEAMATQAIKRNIRWKARTLAWRIRLTDYERTLLCVTTIGAIDCGKVARPVEGRQAEVRIAEVRLAEVRAEEARPF